MKQRAHAYIALRALKLLDDAGKARKLVELLSYYLPDVWEGAWIPDTIIVDNKYGHIYKMESDPQIVGTLVPSAQNRLSYRELETKLVGRRLCLEYVKDSPELDRPYIAPRGIPRVEAGRLPDRVLALTHSIADMLKLSDFPLELYAQERPPREYAGAHLTTQKVRDLSRSPNFSARQIAMACFMLAHYIADAHMPLHCDLRDLKIGGASRLPPKLHDSLEAEWEQYLPSDEQFILHQRTPLSVSQLVTQLPAGSPLAIDTDPRYQLDGRIGWDMAGAEADEMFAICRVSFALSRKWIDGQYPSAPAMQAAIGAAAFQDVTNAIFHDAIAAVARIWNAAWERFVRV